MDRQDIDALLIGALYGELTPADEARLATHLESHPTDRGALDDLKVARQAVHESRIFALHLDPPQHVSALLLQEAHRRAPKRVVATDGKESWFYRFTRSFMAHPAMAAAAMLVLVLGGAGIAYMKKGDQFAEKQVSATSVDRASMPPSMQVNAADPPSAAAGSAAIGEGAAITAGLYEDNQPDTGADFGGRAELAKDQKRAASASDRWEGQGQAVAESKQKKSASRGIQVGTEKGAPKEMERAKGKNDDALAFDADFGNSPRPGAAPTGGGGGGAGAAATGRANSSSGYAQAPPPPAAQAAPAPKKAAPTTTATVTASPTSPRSPEPKAEAPADKTVATAKPSPDKAADAPKQAAAKDSALIAWAKGEHARAVTLAQKGECSTAAKVALSVSSRAGDYYAQFMATDRALKQCAQYINAERDRDAEKSGKARASKRTNAEESPAPTTTTK